MIKQIVFLIVLLLTLGVFAYTVRRFVYFFKLTKPFPVKELGKRFWVMMFVAIFQTKIFRRPVIGLAHALVFWGFLVITVGSVEMVIDGLFGSERSLSMLGGFYDFITLSGDVFAMVVIVALLVFLFRRIFMHVKRFYGSEMVKNSKIDALVALGIILMLMVSLLGMNVFYVAMNPAMNPAGYAGVYPISSLIANALTPTIPTTEYFMLSASPDQTMHQSAGIAAHESVFVFWHELSWWTHILLIFLFANILPYSKHFHVFMSVPNVFLSRLEPLGKLPNMDHVTTEVKIMLGMEQAPAEASPMLRFGVKDATDVNWKNYLDSLACTECGRCTSVCPANLTGKKLSPRKIFMDLRSRMKEIGLEKMKNGLDFEDSRSLLRDFISEEELWACTTCNACAQECPININHPSLIVDMRRFLVMEEAKAPAGLNMMFANIENNGAPWQFSREDRMKWAE